VIRVRGMVEGFAFASWPRIRYDVTMAWEYRNMGIPLQDAGSKRGAGTSRYKLRRIL